MGVTKFYIYLKVLILVSEEDKPEIINFLFDLKRGGVTAAHKRLSVMLGWQKACLI